MSLVTEAQLRGLLLVAEADLTPAEFALWDEVRIEPEVWSFTDAAETGLAVWVVARAGSEVIWFDPRSGLFQAALFSASGRIDRSQGPQGSLSRVLSVDDPD